MKKLRMPLLFLLMSVCGSLLNLIAIHFWLLFSLLTLLLFLNKKIAITLSFILLISTAISNRSVFVNEVEYDGKLVSIKTSKGFFKTDMIVKPGDLLVYKSSNYLTPGFKTIFNTTNWPGIKYYPISDNTSNSLITSKKFIKMTVPLISSILKKRIEHSAALYFKSGGVIKTTQAHILAVKKYIPSEIKDFYIITGLSHLLAMSGFHVGIFTIGLLFIFSFLPFKLRCLPVAFLLLALIPFSGFAITVIRAVALTFVYLIARFADLRVSNLNFLYFLAGIILIFSPESLFSISFLLSFGAVFGIMQFNPTGKSKLITALIIGIASTVLTLPLQLYTFGTSNIVSVFTTIITVPLIWCQMILGLLSVFFTDVIVAPLSYIEVAISEFIKLLSDLSWHFMFISKPHPLALLAMLILSVILIFTKYRILAVLLILLHFLPIYKNNVIVFPNLPPSSKGYILKNDNFSEIFYQGSHYGFVRYMVPAIAEFGRKSFDYGNIRIFDGTNIYIRIKNDNYSGIICINNETELCEYVYKTRSNSINKNNSNKTKKYIIYKNYYESDNIIVTEGQKYEIILK